MKSLLFLFLFIVALSSPSDALSENEGCRERMYPMDKYQFADFGEGRVYFRDGKFTSAKLNYNYAQGAIEFISPAKDTLILTNKTRIDYIALNGTIFYSQPDQGEFEFIERFGEVSLAKKTHLTLKGNKANNTEQRYTSNPESMIPTSLLITNQAGEFRWQNTVSKPNYKVKTDYYLIDQNHRLHPVKKSSLLKIYGKQRSSLSEYLRKVHVDFNDVAQLKELLQFCSSL